MLKPYPLILNLFIAALLLLGSAGPAHAVQSANAEQGVLDMSQHADEQGVTLLSGEWWVNWDQLLEPSDSIEADGLYAIPNTWNKDQEHSKARPGQGFATFRLKLVNIPHDKFWGLRVPEQSTAFKLYIDDRLIAHEGQVSSDPEQAEAYHGVQHYRLGELPESVEIVLQMSNHHHAGGGPWGSIELGPYSELSSRNFGELFRKSLIFALVLIASVFLFIQWLIDRREISSLVLFFFAFIISLRLGIFGVQPLYQVIDPFPWDLHIRILYLSKLLALPLLIYWFSRVYPKDFNSTVTQVIVAIFWFASLLILLMDPMHFTRYLNEVLLMIAAAICYGLTGIVRLVWNRRPGGAVIALGTAALVSGVMHDILSMMQIIKTGVFYFAPSMLVFLLSLMVNLIYLRANEKEQVETLSQKLMRTNRTLETNVEQRTQELAEKALALEDANQKLLILANIDGLTQVLNRRAFIEQCELLSCARPQVAMVLIDVDHFKRVNDSYGHAVGDEVLIKLAKLLSDNTRAVDRVGRFGGEEFVLLLQDFTPDAIDNYCERLLAQVRELDFSDSSKLPGITISAGVVHGELIAGSVDQLLRQADSAMYEVKNSGRDNYKVRDSKTVILPQQHKH